jgi:hypothetical protein|tara:strand:+ start:457 stop:630 length:174 start_codon:yes stop_codon:yes gene_type:complete
MASFLFCKICDEEYLSELCEIHDILESITGRKYLFSCPFCGQEQVSELSEEAKGLHE